MSDEVTPTEEKEKKVQVQIRNNSTGTIYGLGLIGAWMYYFSRATTNDEKLKAFLKGFVWPVVLVKEALAFFNKE